RAALARGRPEARRGRDAALDRGPAPADGAAPPRHGAPGDAGDDATARRARPGRAPAALDRGPRGAPAHGRGGRGPRPRPLPDDRRGPPPPALGAGGEPDDDLVTDEARSVLAALLVEERAELDVRVSIEQFRRRLERSQRLRRAREVSQSI